MADIDNALAASPEELRSEDGDDYYFWHKWLVDPIKRGDLPAIRKYLDEGGGIHIEEFPTYYDPFVVAAKRPDPAALRMLLDHWAVKPTPDLPGPSERGVNLFLTACCNGALETVRYLLDEQPALADLHTREVSPLTPILVAAQTFVGCALEEGRTRFLDEQVVPERFIDAQVLRERVHRSEALVHLLLDRGAYATDREDYSKITGWYTRLHVTADGQEDTVLSFAIARAGPALLRRLIREGADVYATTEEGIHGAMSRGCLFENTGNTTGLTLMHLGAFYGNYTGIEVVLERYAQDGRSRTDAMSARDQFGRLPIHYAAAGWPGAVSTIRSGAEDGSNDAPPETYFGNDTAALIRVLTDNGDVRLSTAGDAAGETPLHYAVSRNTVTRKPSIALARFLCAEFHASAAVRGRDGQTPLHRLYDMATGSVSWGVGVGLPIDTGLVGVLLDLPGDRAVDINAVDDAGKTPLHCAAFLLGDLPGVQFLLGRGADVHVRNKAGRTPLHMAADGGLGAIYRSVTVAQSIQAQDAMLALLCGNTDAGLVLDKNESPLMEEPDAEGKTPRQLAEETRARWRHEEATRSKPVDWTRGRGRGRGRGA